MGAKPYAKTRCFEKRERFRHQLFAAQAGLCHLCGKVMSLERKSSGDVPKDFATFDHVIPRAAGGTSAKHNIKLAHKRCNSKRNDKPVADSVPFFAMPMEGM